MTIMVDAETGFVTLRFGKTANSIYEYAGDLILKLAEAPENQTILAAILTSRIAHLSQLPIVLASLQSEANISIPDFNKPAWDAIRKLCRELVDLDLSALPSR